MDKPEKGFRFLYSNEDLKRRELREKHQPTSDFLFERRAIRARLMTVKRIMARTEYDLQWQKMRIQKLKTSEKTLENVFKECITFFFMAVLWSRLWAEKDTTKPKNKANVPLNVGLDNVPLNSDNVGLDVTCVSLNDHPEEQHIHHPEEQQIHHPKEQQIHHKRRQGDERVNSTEKMEELRRVVIEVEEIVKDNISQLKRNELVLQQRIESVEQLCIAVAIYITVILFCCTSIE